MPSLTTMSRDKSRDFTFWLGRAYEDRAKVNLHTSWGHGLTGASVTFGGEEGDDLTLGVKLYFFAFWLTFHGFIPWSWRRASHARAEARAARYTAEDRRARKQWEDAGRPGQAPPTRCHYAYEIDPLLGRKFSVRIFGGSVWWALWHADHGWRSDDRRVWPWEGYGWTYTWPVVDWLLGKMRYKRQQLDSAEVVFTMPEGYGYEAAEHRAEVVTERRQWWRSRWPWGRVDNITVEVTVEGGVPHPGKGTTAYNCDEDALITASTVVDETPWGQAPMLGTTDHPLDTDELRCWQQAGIQHFIESATEYRRRYPL